MDAIPPPKAAPAFSYPGRPPGSIARSFRRAALGPAIIFLVMAVGWVHFPMPIGFRLGEFGVGLALVILGLWPSGRPRIRVATLAAAIGLIAVYLGAFLAAMRRDHALTMAQMHTFRADFIESFPKYLSSDLPETGGGMAANLHPLSGGPIRLYRRSEAEILLRWHRERAARYQDAAAHPWGAPVADAAPPIDEVRDRSATPAPAAGGPR